VNALPARKEFAVVDAPQEALFCLAPSVLLSLLTELGKYRALADHETDIVEAIVCRGHRTTGLRVRWTKPLDRRLMTAANRRGGIQLFAKANSIPPKAAYDRLCKLRKAKATNGRAQG
jgi:hypothetical protein